MTLGQYELIGRLGARVHGTRHGNEPPVVLLHGLTYDHRQWDTLIEELTAREPGRLIIAFDLPGHGRSPDAESCRPADIALSLHRSLDAFGAAAPVVVGHSFGAVVATAYAAVHPAAGVVNIDQPLLAGTFAKRLRELEPLLRGPRWRDVWDEQLAAMGIDALPPRARELVRTATAPRQELLLAYWQELLEESSEELARRRTWQLRAIRHAGVDYTHVTGGEVPQLYAQWLTALLPTARLVTFPGSGHFPHLLHPAAIAGLLTG
ncbi:alpha/beta hydrolase [Streptomyces sp. SID8111]|uniref:alpha/beta fold hydrolase n=1 Tax=Streptomyces sp. SID8111 TaxID=2706100 RepID=UPI0013C1241C|nr:alpha/beta hydrolase [Streptomyces sp. SID8111]NEC27114.1 alpha/beta hydrolase [Streptomyces sp. SID8111]